MDTSITLHLNHKKDNFQYNLSDPFENLRLLMTSYSKLEQIFKQKVDDIWLGVKGVD